MMQNVRKAGRRRLYRCRSRRGETHRTRSDTVIDALVENKDEVRVLIGARHVLEGGRLCVRVQACISMPRTTYLEAGVDPAVLDESNILSRSLLERGVVLGAKADKYVLGLAWGAQDDVCDARRVVCVDDLGAQRADLRKSGKKKAQL